MLLHFIRMGLFRFLALTLKVQNTSTFPPPLSREEETRLFLEMKNGSRAARDRLIEHNLRLVAHIIKKYYTGAKDQEDLISIGTIGLIKAIDSFEVQNGTRFATYGGRCVQNEILMYFRSLKKTSLETSVNETLELDKDGNPLTILDVISVEDTALEEVDLKIKTHLALEGIRTVLDPRERTILIRRYGLNGKKGMTQKEVAKKMNISRSYVSRIEKAALEKLKAYIEKPRNYL